jgi:hypothetical protein
MPTLDASAVECHVLTFKEGALSALAHDLELRVTRLTVQIDREAAEAGDASPRAPAAAAAPFKISARFAADSLQVLHALKDGRPTDQLSASDRRKIEKTLTGDVLDVRRHPDIRYEGTATPLGAGNGDGSADTGDGRLAITGELTLQGRRRPLGLTAHLRDGRWHAETTLHQPDFGVQPYSALLGALKLRPDVQVRISLPWPLPA